MRVKQRGREGGLGLPRLEFLGLGQSREAGEQERRQELRLVLAWSDLASSLTQRFSTQLQVQGSWEAALSNTTNKTQTRG